MATWVQTSPGQIYPGGSSSPGRPGSHCPQGWEEDFDRSQMSTQVLINRQGPSEIPTLRFIFPADAGTVPPAPGEMTLNDTQTAATVMYASETDDLGVDARLWFDYLHAGCHVTIQTLADTKESRAYVVTGDLIDNGTYFDIPIAWTQGTNAVPHGPVDMTLSVIPRPPQLWEDLFGVDHYGRMVFSRTDLISVNEDLFETLADLILEVRGSNSVPRLASVTLDARTGYPGHNMDLMSLSDPGKPSRYFCCLNVNGRNIFSRMCFATAIRHFIARNEWTLTITLDVSQWAAVL